MIFVAWNYRGVGNRGTLNHARDFMMSKDVGAVCFLETKTSCFARMEKVARKMGYSKVFNVDPLGFAGGLLLFWRPGEINLEVVGHTSQVIHCVVKDNRGMDVRISFAYVRPNRLSKEMFWRECRSYSESFQGPWVMLGDFNDIANVTEQWGSEEINHGNVNRFIEARDRCNLSDLGNTGPISLGLEKWVVEWCSGEGWIE